MTMQSTGQGARHSSQPVHCGGDDGMHLLGGADDGVDRAGLDAERAADAGLSSMTATALGLFDAVFAGERLEFAARAGRRACGCLPRRRAGSS